MKDEVKFLCEIFLLTVSCHNEEIYGKIPHLWYELADHCDFEVNFF